MNLTIHEKALIIELLERRRIYFEGKNNKLAKECSNLILKIHRKGN
jgi:hypothetical protein